MIEAYSKPMKPPQILAMLDTDPNVRKFYYFFISSLILVLFLIMVTLWYIGLPAIVVDMMGVLFLIMVTLWCIGLPVTVVGIIGVTLPFSASVIMSGFGVILSVCTS
jgi:hypothetical protein